MKKALPGVRFINAFGLGEMTPVSLSSYDEDYEDFYKTAGKPIDIINVKVIDTATGEECKKGQTGEIYVDGTNLMTCYYKQDISSQSIDENGWLRTGDLGYFDEEKVKSFLAKRLSKQKIPDYFLVYEKLPTLSNGKTDTVTLKKEAAKAVKETERK